MIGKLSFFFLSLSILFTSSAHAFLIANYDAGPIDYKRETDFFVIGYAGELGSGFLRTAATYAHKTREQFPGRQIVFVAENRTKDGTDSKKFIAIGFNPVYFDAEPFTADKLMAELKAFSQIHTLHVVSHNALESGVGLTDQVTGGRFNHKTPGLDQVKFTKDGYVVLHGCNTGWLQAPEMSKLFKVPVFGSLTATNFQQIFDDNEWYFHDKGLYPETAQFLKTNDVSFFNPVSCAKGGCYRLKADFFTYNGFWGDFNQAGGLSFFKAFCTMSNKTTDNKAPCLKAMRQWMQIFPSHLPLPAKPTLEQYKAVVKDHMCGLRLNHPLRQECYDKLAEAETKKDLTYAGFSGNPLNCPNFGACLFTYSCKDSNHTCQLKAPKTTKPTTIVDEYRAYLEAF